MVLRRKKKAKKVARKKKLVKLEPKVEVKEELVVEKAEEGYVAIRDISQKYRQGDEVSVLQVEQWKSMGIKVDLMVKKV